MLQILTMNKFRHSEGGGGGGGGTSGAPYSAPSAKISDKTFASDDSLI